MARPRIVKFSCPACGSDSLICQRKGKNRQLVIRYYRCGSCGHRGMLVSNARKSWWSEKKFQQLSKRPCFSTCKGCYNGPKQREKSMNDNFRTANQFTQKWEKGYVNHPNDPGGATYNGVSLRFLKQTGTDINVDGVINAQDILDLYRRKDQAKVDDIFYRAFWRDPKLDLLACLPVQIAVYDCNVNTGRTQSAKCLQRACNRVHGADRLAVDGIIGPKTRELARDLSCQGKGLAVAHACVEERLKFHNMLVANSPYPDGRDYRPFAKGWDNRCADLNRYAASVARSA